MNSGWLFVTGTDGKVWTKACSHASCNLNWISLGGQAFDSPGTSSFVGTPRVITDVVVRGRLDQALYQLAFSPQGFGAWHKAWTPSNS